MNQLQNTSIVESLIIKGDLSGLNQEQKIVYYRQICERLGLDPVSQPFKLLSLQGKQVLYLDRSGAQQLNKLHGISHEVRSREMIIDAGVYQVTARASDPKGRFTDSIGAVNIGGLKGDAYANAIMKAETKAKRRATMDLLGLGMLDETEVETIKDAVAVPVPTVTVGQIDYLHQLLETSTYDQPTRDRLALKIDNIQTAEEFDKALENLEANQLGIDGIVNPSQKDISKHIKKIAS